ncbi:MAG: hypothetical protein L6R28_21070 [Planctomycetes bacterium]|nr:hypothetical protein [Planctomycetota bacterium]
MRATGSSSAAARWPKPPWRPGSSGSTTGAADSRQTIEAMKRGALDCLVAPFTHEELRKRLTAALGISRTTLRKKMAELKIEVDVYVQK